MDRDNHNYPQCAASVPQKHYPTAHSTSSAFSASANPNEDWTKISDLAERRRIQNRIAQRNYRKKLKKRLEDLERRAGSSSASPEQQHEELAQPERSSSNQAPNIGSQRQQWGDNQIRRSRTPETLKQHYSLPSDDRNMFSQQYTRQLSTSPPPFSYGSIPTAESINYSTYPPATTYCNVLSTDVPVYSQYLPPIQHTYANVGLATPPLKQEFYSDDDINPFSMSYASIAGLDVAAAQAYQDVAAYVNTPVIRILRVMFLLDPTYADKYAQDTFSAIVRHMKELVDFLEPAEWTKAALREKGFQLCRRDKS